MYIGETSRGCYIRYLQEKAQCNPRAAGFMWKHVEEKHNGDRATEFAIRRERIDPDPMRRVIRESLRIEKVEKDPSVILMNTKEEHFGTQTVRSSFGTDWLEK